MQIQSFFGSISGIRMKVLLAKVLSVYYISTIEC